MANYVAQVRSTREWLKNELQALGLKCWPSEANFLLANFGDLRPKVLQTMRENRIALRDRPDCKGCIRISIGTQTEMERVLSVLKQVMAETAVAHQVAE